MINPQTIAQIKACESVYSVGDTARHFNVSKSTVHRIWNGAHAHIAPAVEPENIKSSRISKEVIIEDGRTLLARGMRVPEIAQALGVSTRTVYNRLNEAGVSQCYFF